MSGHTPGSWRVIVNDEVNPQILAADGEKLIGEFPTNGHPPDSTLMPDVRLMAAAPDLLSACQGLIKMMDDGLLVRDISGDGASGWAIKQLPLVLAVKAATEAIAKAAGDDS